jgi:D-sedoheptulose 7-phosphate isomerase
LAVAFRGRFSLPYRGVAEQAISVAGMSYRSIFEESAANLLAACTDSYLAAIPAAVDTIVGAFETGGKLLVFGNGGSCADAEHICGELVGRFLRERRGLPALALASNPAILTAIGNDYGFEAVFERQIQALGRVGDVAWGISTSGDSENVVRGLRCARELGLKTVGLTGCGGGKSAQWCDVLMAVALAETPRVQEVHQVTYHIICDAIETRLFGN